MVIKVNVITDDAVLARRLMTYARRIDKLDIATSEHPLNEHETDVYVVPVAQMGQLLDGSARPRTWVPVIGYGNEGSLRAAFLAGCGDYLREPWAPEELALRVLRIANSSLFAAPWGTVHLQAGSASTEYGEVALSVQESRILRVLLMQLGTPVPREALYYALWGRTGRSSRAVDVHVSSLRRKLRRIAAPARRLDVIRSARGLGYFIPAGER